MKQWDCWQSEKGEGYTFLWGASMTPLKDIYFSSIQGGAVRHGNRDMVVALGLMALVLLVSAVFNYINLTMAQVGKRAKETATRRLLGDTIPMVVGRHFAEALIFVLGSFACAGILALVLRPWFEGLVDTRVYFFVDVWTVLGTAMLTFSIAFVAGLLPAMIASRFKPIDVMKGSFRFYNRKWLSRVFIVLQNCISTTLIAIGLTMALQMHHLDTLPMGYDTEGIVEIRTFDLYKRLDELQPLVNALKALPEVKDVGNAATLPYSCEYNGVHIPDGSGEATQTSWISQSRMDSTSFKMLGFKVIEQYCVPEEDYLWISEETRNRYGVSADRPYFGGQHVDGEVQQVHDKERTYERHGDDQAWNQRHAPVTQEQEDDDDYQYEGFVDGAFHLGYGGAYELGVVETIVVLHVIRQVLLHHLHAFVHGIRYVYVVGSWLWYDNYAYHWYAVHLHVTLDVAGREFCTTYVAESDNASLGLLDDKVVELLRGRHLSHGAYAQFTCVALDGA